MIKLVPVIEIAHYGGEIPSPEGPYWKHPTDWDRFHIESLQQAGYPDIMTAYLTGSSFYRPNNITDSNLVKLVRDKTADMRQENYDTDLVSSFRGGYILQVDGLDVLYPQCCCDLNSIYDWKELANGKEEGFYNGHPTPLTTLQNGIITFNLPATAYYGERFVPDHPQPLISISKSDLISAVDTVVDTELKVFAARLIKINTEEKLGIDNIDRLLIWGDR
ncbi:hypothetical protein ACTHGU_07895 [Chitinophagaceae bacterium MMS25-I14]